MFTQDKHVAFAPALMNLIVATLLSGMLQFIYRPDELII